MSRYYTNEAVFDLPDIGFADSTVHSIEVRLPRNRELRLVVARFPVPAGEDFQEVIAAQVKRQAARISGYAVTERRDAEVAGRPAIVLRSRWRKDGARFYERQAHVAASAETRMLIAMTGPATAERACDEHFQRILDTLKLRDGGELA